MRAFFGEGAIVAGVLSGTSADGIDVGIARIRASERAGELALEPPELLVYACEPFPAALRARVRSVLDGAPCGLREAALLDRDLGRAFGTAARAVAERYALKLDLVGSHGQTVWHHDGAEASGPATLQLGDGDFVAEASGATTVSDFRQRDVAAGGEGAPLSPLADALIFARLERPSAVLNLGGMGNLTLLLSGGGLMAFDTGPANSLLDGLARRLLSAEMDADGAVAARGRPDAGLVAELARHPFLARKPPKSTGRDTFGATWVDAVVDSARRRGLLEPEESVRAEQTEWAGPFKGTARDASSRAEPTGCAGPFKGTARGPEDLLATAVDFVAATVADALVRFAPERPRELIVAGGGALNPAQMAALARRTGLPVRSSAALGLDPKAREALVFAVLAAACALGLAVTHPGATGAAAGRPLGKISPCAPGCRPGSAG